MSLRKSPGLFSRLFTSNAAASHGHHRAILALLDFDLDQLLRVRNVLRVARDGDLPFGRARRAVSDVLL